ncbi:hypothetical protein T484DRAFT_1594020, partial [Baffinella frigidus]
ADGAECIACVAGTYKSSTGSAACDLCATSLYSTTVAATAPDTCLDCGIFTRSNKGSGMKSDCSCIDGYSGDMCTQCAAGVWCSLGVKTTCPMHTSSSAGSNELIDCKCIAGYTAVSDGVSCSACPHGTYKHETGIGACSLCATGTNSSLASTEHTDCTCIAGHTAGFDGVVCEACEEGTYKVVTGPGACSKCPTGTSSGPHSVALDDCKCFAGYTAASDGVVCDECMPGTYKTSTGVADCTTCPVHSGSESGSDALAACICFPGYVTSSDGSSCDAWCDAGTFMATRPTEHNSTQAHKHPPHECLPCPYGTRSLSESGVLTDCKCLSGYMGMSDGVACTVCSAGTFKSAFGVGDCAVCPEHTYSHEGSSGVTDCLCVIGYTADSDGVECSPCTAGTYKSITGASQCSACPVTMSSLEGS